MADDREARNIPVESQRQVPPVYLIPKFFDTNRVFGDPWGRNAGLGESGFSRTWKSEFGETWEKSFGDDNKGKVVLEYSVGSHTSVMPLGETHQAHGTVTDFKVRFEGFQGKAGQPEHGIELLQRELGQFFSLAREIGGQE